MDDKVVTLGHGAGGEAMRRLIKELFVEQFSNPLLDTLGDAAVLNMNQNRLAFTTDSYVVKPLEFPGGDIGKLAVCGTINDLVVMGARPLYLSAGFILEEGFSISTLKKIINSMSETARSAQVQIVTGDTKVVPRGECDGAFINTAGLGICPLGHGLSESPIVEGDAVVISGTVGDHGIAILGAREGLALQTTIQSDCAPLHDLIGSVLNESKGVKWMRDPTRGGLAATLTELAEAQNCDILIREVTIPVQDGVKAVCELLGFEPLHLANEGKVVMIVEAGEANRVVELLHQHPLGHAGAMIGRVAGRGKSVVRIETEAGGIRRLHRPAGELLPRIC
jgi:hydrogenase expression/formation protein HypE